MSGKAPKASTGAPNWTEDEKYTLILHLIDQLMNDGSVKLSEINMPNRTTKALGHEWRKIRTDIKTRLHSGDDANAGPSQASTGSVAAPKTPAGKKKAKGEVNTPNAAKRRKPTPKETPKKRKDESFDDEHEVLSNVKDTDDDGPPSDSKDNEEDYEENQI